MAGNGVSDNSFFNPEKLLFRVTLLIGICFLTFGSYFVYDIPSALQGPLIARMGLSDIEYGALYSVYSWPNTVLALIGGFLVDRVFGIRLGAIIFCMLVFIGQFVFALGVQVNSFWIAAAGRFIFGLGGESLSVSQSTYTAKWFAGKELALAFGIALSFSRVGSAVNFNVTPVLASAFSVPMAVWIGVAVCLISMLFAMILAFWDYQAEKFRRGTDSAPKTEEKIELRDVKDFPLSLWLLVFICISFYIAVFIFTQYGGDFFRQKWDLSLERRDNLLSIPSIFSAAASPFLGGGVDYVGRSLTWVVSACATLCGVHLYMVFIPGHNSIAFPMTGMLVMGAAYSVCAAALWPCVALIMPPHQLGTAYGLMTALQNLGLAVAPLAVGGVLKATNKDYVIMEFIFAGSAAVATGITVLLIFVDIARNGGKLNASSKKRKEMEAMNDKQESTPLLINSSDQFDKY